MRKIYKLLIVTFLFCALTKQIIGRDTTLVTVINTPYSIYSIASDSLGTIWLSGSRGLKYYDFEKESFLTEDPANKSYIVSIDGKIVPFVGSKDQPSFPWEKHEDWLKKLPPGYNRITTAKDKFGNYWVSTGSHLFVYSIESRFERLFPTYSTRGIFIDGKDIYVNTYNHILKNGKVLFDKPRYAVGEIKKIGAHIYFAWGGLLRYEPSTNEKTYLNFCGALGDLRNPRPIEVLAIEQHQDTIWVGTTYGLGRIEGDSVIMITNRPNIQDLKTSEKGLLIASRDLTDPEKMPNKSLGLPEPVLSNYQGLFRKQQNELKKVDLPERNFRQILYSEGTYYFATDSGVIVWRGDKTKAIYTEKEGLTDNLTCGLAMDKHGFLWVSTFSGLNRINLSTGYITNYLQNTEFNYRSTYQNDSLIYMGSVKGLFILNPDFFLGDDILELDPEQSYAYTFLIMGVCLIFTLYIFYLRRGNRQRIELKDQKLKELNKKLFLSKIDHVVYNSDIAITVGNLANLMGISERTMYRDFKQYDLTPGNYLKELRLKKAKQILSQQNDEFDLEEVSKKVGYTKKYLRKILDQNN